MRNEYKNWTLKKYIADLINIHIENFEIDADKIADTTAIKILTEIQKILKDTKNTDFEIVEKIVILLEENGISCGSCHDFS